MNVYTMVTAATLGPVGYLSVGVAVGRAVYGRLRAWCVDSRRYCLFDSATDRGALFDELDRPPVAAAAVAAVLLWPAVPVIAAAWCVVSLAAGIVTHNPLRRSAWEREHTPAGCDRCGAQPEQETHGRRAGH